MKVSQGPRPRVSTKHASFLQKAILQHSSDIQSTPTTIFKRAVLMLSVNSPGSSLWAFSLQLCTVRALSHTCLLSYSTPKSQMLLLLCRIYSTQDGFLNLFIFKRSLFIIVSLLICSFPDTAPETQSEYFCPSWKSRWLHLRRM